MINVSRTFFFVFCFSGLLFLSGCSSVPGNKGEGSQENMPDSDKGEVTLEETPEETIKEPPKSPVLAREIEDKQPELDAVKYLLDQAQQAIEDSETERAIALSDRALKVDRKSPRAYLVLAQAYYLEKRSDRARATAKQGLLYTSARSFIGKQLLKLVELN